MPLVCLPPLSQQFVGLMRGVPRALGTILIVMNADKEIALIPEARKYHLETPWCPVVASCEALLPADLVSLAVPGTAQIALPGDAGPLTPAATRAAVRTRPVPDSTDLAAYILLRTSTRLAGLFMDCVCSHNDATRYRRPLRQLGNWSPRDCRNVDATVKLLAHAARQSWTEQAAANSAGIDVKTLSSRCRWLFGYSWPELRGLGAWEAALEASLRRGILDGDRGSALQGGNEH